MHLGAGILSAKINRGSVMSIESYLAGDDSIDFDGAPSLHSAYTRVWEKEQVFLRRTVDKKWVFRGTVFSFYKDYVFGGKRRVYSITEEGYFKRKLEGHHSVR